ncbi:MAG TPA: hypothetical protein DDW50_12290 [Firmicutes bacterium]|jgi:hypothetical protein|nr:hypothetical protein [Bacillota bacterium]
MNDKIPVSEILCQGKEVRIELVNYYGNKIIIKATVLQMDDKYLIFTLSQQEGIFNQVHVDAEVKVVCGEEVHPGTIGPLPEKEYIFYSKFIKVRGDDSPQLIVSIPFASSEISDRRPELNQNLPFSYFLDEKEIKGGVVIHLTSTGLMVSIKSDSALEIGLGISFRLTLPTSPSPLLLMGTITGIWKDGGKSRITLDFSHTPLDFQDQITKYLFSLPKNPVVPKEKQSKAAFIKIN